LANSIFPLGDSTKAEVRREAARRGLAVADKPDSHDICFIADGDTRKFLAQRLGEEPGDIVDGQTGAVLGGHQGAYAYTVGQRRGLRLDRPAPDGRPRYVLSITPKTRTVTVGPAEALEVSTVYADRPVWTAEGSAPDTAVECEVQLRAHGETVPATIQLTDRELTAALHRPARGVAAGQAIVAYQSDPAGDVVLGSATISGTGESADVGPGVAASSAAGGGSGLAV
jgi:tRNA-specific 2-thiouridylase